MEKPIVGKKYIYRNNNEKVKILGYSRCGHYLYFEYEDGKIDGMGCQDSTLWMLNKIREPLKLLQEVFVKARISATQPSDISCPIKICKVEFIGKGLMTDNVVTEDLIYIKNSEGKIVPYCSEEE